MSSVALFCIAEDAKSSCYALMSGEKDSRLYDLFSLIESRAEPPPEGKFKRTLQADEHFETGFIGLRDTDCQAWSLQYGPDMKSLYYDIIAVVDERSAKDETMMIQFFNLPPALDFPPRFGNLPPRLNEWYTFRVRFGDAFTVISNLANGAFDVVYPDFFGRSQDFTNESGVFDASAWVESLKTPRQD